MPSTKTKTNKRSGPTSGTKEHKDRQTPTLLLRSQCDALGSLPLLPQASAVSSSPFPHHLGYILCHPASPCLTAKRKSDCCKSSPIESEPTSLRGTCRVAEAVCMYNMLCWRFCRAVLPAKDWLTASLARRMYTCICQKINLILETNNETGDCSEVRRGQRTFQTQCTSSEFPTLWNRMGEILFTTFAFLVFYRISILDLRQVDFFVSILPKHGSFHATPPLPINLLFFLD